MTSGVASRKAEAEAASVLLVERVLWKPLRRELKLLKACIKTPWWKRGNRWGGGQQGLKQEAITPADVSPAG
jgi:hypothetical protein